MFSFAFDNLLLISIDTRSGPGCKNEIKDGPHYKNTVFKHGTSGYDYQYYAKKQNTWKNEYNENFQKAPKLLYYPYLSETQPLAKRVVRYQLKKSKFNLFKTQKYIIKM